MAPGKQNVRAACPKDKLEFKFFPSPALLCILIFMGCRIGQGRYFTWDLGAPFVSKYFGCYNFINL